MRARSRRMRHDAPRGRRGDLRGGPVSRILSGGSHPLDDHSSSPAVACRIKLPTRTARGEAPLPAPFPGTRRTVPIRRCSRWGLPCRSGCPSRGGLLPHRFTLTPASEGGLFSVALSVGSPRPGVTRHRRFMESGLSSDPQLSANAELWAPAAIQPSARGLSTPGRTVWSMGRGVVDARGLCPRLLRRLPRDISVRLKA